MSVKLVMRILLESALSPRLKLTTAILANYATDDGHRIYPSVARIAHLAGKSRRSVTADLTELIAMGVLVPVSDRSGGRGRSTAYHLELAAMPWLVPFEQPRKKHEASFRVSLSVSLTETMKIATETMKLLTGNHEVVDRNHDGGFTRSDQDPVSDPVNDPYALRVFERHEGFERNPPMSANDGDEHDATSRLDGNGDPYRDRDPGDPLTGTAQKIAQQMRTHPLEAQCAAVSAILRLKRVGPRPTAEIREALAQYAGPPRPRRVE